MRKILASTLILAGVLSVAGSAEAPTFIASAVNRQTDMGYRPCKPTVTPLPQELAANGILADAAPTEMFQVCEIRVWQALKATDFEWVAWHEVCHLSTLADIWADPHRTIIDAAHAHPAFRQCIARGPDETGGY